MCWRSIEENVHGRFGGEPRWVTGPHVWYTCKMLRVRVKSTGANQNLPCTPPSSYDPWLSAVFASDTPITRDRVLSLSFRQAACRLWYAAVMSRTYASMLNFGEGNELFPQEGPLLDNIKGLP